MQPFFVLSSNAQRCSTAWKHKEQLQRRLMVSSVELFIKTLQWLTCPHLSCANNVHVVETEWNLKWQNGNNKCTLISPSDFKPIAGIQIIGCGTSSQRAGKNKEDKRERKGRDFPAHIPEQAIRHCSCLNHLINLWFVFYQVQNTPVHVFNT